MENIFHQFIENIILISLLKNMYSSVYWMTKFANAIRRQLSSEVAFVECQKLMKSFQTLVSGFPDKPKAAFSWPNELKQFHSIWQICTLQWTGSKSQSENGFLKDAINKFGAFHIKSGDKSFDAKVVVGSMTNKDLGDLIPVERQNSSLGALCHKWKTSETH